MDFTSGEIITILGALGVLITTITAGIVTIIKTMQSGQDQVAAAAAITAEQQNRYLATRDAVPVTMQSPPMGTGDGRIDKAVMNQLAAAPTSPSTVAAVVGPEVPLLPPEPPAVHPV